tara:strand:- start:254 stop:511 length:258 start_codon:yes stop_codon:yes gene_type:complete
MLGYIVVDKYGDNLKDSLNKKDINNTIQCAPTFQEHSKTLWPVYKDKDAAEDLANFWRGNVGTVCQVKEVNINIGKVIHTEYKGE